MKIINPIKIFALAATISITPLSSAGIHAQTHYTNTDVFERSITPDGTTDKKVLMHAPSPEIIIAGKPKNAGIVVDLKRNILYTYDFAGNPTKAYLVASGKKSTPTPEGIFKVSHKEYYPYKNAPAGTKRRRSPKDYGKYIICLKVIDVKTGEENSTGYFIHGCKSYHDTFETVPDRRVSHGCVRMSDIGIEETKEVSPGTYILFTRNAN